MWSFDLSREGGGSNPQPSRFSSTFLTESAPELGSVQPPGSRLTWIRVLPDAEPKYLVAVQPIPVNDVKKHCTGR